MRALVQKDVVRLLRSEVNRAGGQTKWAKQNGIVPSAISMVLAGDRPPNKKIISALKLRRVIVFERVDDRGAQGGLGNRKTGHSRIQKGPQWVKRGQYPAACPCWVRPGACPRAWPSCGICSPPRAPPRAISDGPMAAPLTHEKFHSSGVSEAQNALCDRHHIGGLGNSLYTPRRGETPRNRVAVSRGHFRSSVLFNRNGALCA